MPFLPDQRPPSTRGEAATLPLENPPLAVPYREGRPSSLVLQMILPAERKARLEDLYTNMAFPEVW